MKLTKYHHPHPAAPPPLPTPPPAPPSNELPDLTLSHPFLIQKEQNLKYKFLTDAYT